jgi:LysR family transcriptional regulator, flagellar master operon regulator
MDIAQARTFLEIAASGSFVAAAGRLNVTQTAVSARVKALEESLGRQLFVRNKSGARLTPAGERFLRHATTLVQVWDQARQQVGLPPGRIDIASVGAEISLWNPILAAWLVWMKASAPEIALHAEVDTPARLLERLHNGALDMAVLYNPPAQGGDLVVELLAEERLVLVSTTPLRLDEVGSGYVHVEWGPAFDQSFHAAFPDLASGAVTVSHGPLALLYLLEVGGCGYFRLGVAQPYLDAGRLHIIPDAPEFAHSVHLVYSAQRQGGLVDQMREGFRTLSARHHPSVGPRPAPV